MCVCVCEIVRVCGGSSPHLECAWPTDSSAFYLSLVLQICMRCQQWNPAAVIPRKKKKKRKRAPLRRLSLVVLEIMPPTCPFNRVLPEIREAAELRGLSEKRYRGKDEGEGLHAAFHF